MVDLEEFGNDLEYSARYCNNCEARCIRKGEKFICPKHGKTNTYTR